MALPARQIADQNSQSPQRKEGKIIDFNAAKRDLDFKRSLNQAKRSTPSIEDQPPLTPQQLPTENQEEQSGPGKNNIERAGQVSQLAGKTAQVAGGGAQVAGAGVKAAGKIAEPIAGAAGAGIGGAVGGLGGAIAGGIAGSIIPGAGTLAGAAAGARAGASGGAKAGQTTGRGAAKGLQAAGQGLEKSGKGLRQAGSNLNAGGKNLKAQGRLLNQLRRGGGDNKKNTLKNKIAQPAQMASGAVLQKAWLLLIPSWGFSWFYIAFHFLAAYFSPFSNIFVKFGQEWIPRSLKKAGGQAAESVGKKLEIPEMAGCGCIGCIWLLVLSMIVLLFIVVGYVMMQGPIGVATDALGLLGSALWEYITSWFI